MQRRTKVRLLASITAVTTATAGLLRAQPGPMSNAPPGDVLLLDSLGNVVHVPTNTLPKGVMRTEPEWLSHQIPQPLEGAKPPFEVRERHKSALGERHGFEFFPPIAPFLMRYLGSLDEFGNTALKPGTLIPPTVLEQIVQQPKYWLSERGVRYSFDQTFTGLGMSDVKEGDNSMGFYTLDLKMKWNIYDAHDAGAAGWVTTQVEAKSGLNPSGRLQNPSSNLGTITSPNETWSSINGFRVPELAWQQSLDHGRFVTVAGMVSQRNYFDGNAYAHTAHGGQFLNNALVHSLVLPLAQYNFGLNLQWQPVDEFYAMVGASAGNNASGNAPWIDFNWNTWSLLGEFGYAPDNVLGLGPGVYRIQPFVAQKNGPTQGGLAFDLQQQLGENCPFGWFGRFGFGGKDVTSDAAAQIGSGFVVKGPLSCLGIPSRKHDSAGLAFIWSQPSSTTKTIHHENEYTMETGYVLQLTPTVRLQPDLQVIWNPAFNADPGPLLAAQLQLDLLW